MSTKLKAGTATSGAVIDADTSGILELQSGSTPTTAITVDTAQNVGVGVASPAAKLDVNGEIRTSSNIVRGTGGDSVYLVGGTNNNNNIYLGGASAGTPNTIGFTTSGSERMRIDSSGNLLVGTASSWSGNLRVQIAAAAGASSLSCTAASTASSDQVYFRNPNGIVGSINSNGSSTSYVTSSDYRLKENIAPMQNALNVVQQLKPVTYTWKVDGSNSQGFIAHELAEVVPDAVTGEKDAVNEDGSIKPQGIDTSFLVATLTAALQELNAKVTALEAQLGVK